MSISGDNQPPPAANAAGRADDPQARLAHELANLLDGSLRNVGLVMSSLRDSAGDAARPTEDEDLVARLEAANHAMQHMATLLQRWMGRARPVAALHHQAATLGETIRSAADLLAPGAATRNITIEVHINDAAGRTPAGPIYAVIANALRNSVEAISQGGPGKKNVPGRIEIRAQVIGQQVEVIVRDNGPGVSAEIIDERGGFLQGVTTKGGGHGLGLALARDIARGLGGTLELTNRPAGGAELVVRYPLASVARA